MVISSIGTEGFAHHPQVITPAAAPRAPGVQAPTERGRSGDRNDSQKQDKRSTSFRELLNAEAVESTEKRAGVSQTHTAAPTGGATPFRPEKLPSADTMEVSADAVPDVFIAQLARNVGIDMAAQDHSFISSASREFLDAATRYTERLIAASKTYARPGDSLETTA